MHVFTLCLCPPLHVGVFVFIYPYVFVNIEETMSSLRLENKFTNQTPGSVVC